MKFSSGTLAYLFGILAIIGIIASSYFALQSQSQTEQIQTLLQERSFLQDESNAQKVALAASEAEVEELDSELKELKDDLDDLIDDYEDEQNRNEEFEDQLKDLAGTLGDLEKLEGIDEELLAKYSKVSFLNENYMPDKVEKINNRYVQDGKDPQYFHARAIDFLEDMFKAAADDDIDLLVVSAYRSFDEQTALKGQFTQIYGTGANAFSADQGFSEHQLGTTVDITVESVGGTFNSFAETEAYEWLLDNAYKYGFILSYPEGNEFYIFEPWHWRFVGTDLARKLDRSDETFYTMDQREINTYLLELFD